MKTQGRDEIENLFRKGLGSFESEPDGYVWEAIQKGIKKKRRKFLWILFPSVLLAVVLAAAVFSYAFKNEKTADIIYANGQTEEKSNAGGKTSINPDTETGSTHDEQHNIQAVKKSNNTGQKESLTKNETVRSNKSKNTSAEAGGGKESLQDKGNLVDTAGSTTENLLDAIGTVAESAQADILNDTAENEIPEEKMAVEEPEKKDTAQLKVRYVGDENNKQVFTNRFMVSVYAKPVWTPLPRLQDKVVLPSFVQQKPINLKMAAGLGMQYQVSKRLFLSAGFEYFRAQQDLHFTSYKYVENSKTVKTISSNRKVQRDTLKWKSLVPDKNHTYTTDFEIFNYPLNTAFSLFATQKFSITATGCIAFTRIIRTTHTITDSSYYSGAANEVSGKQRYMSVSLGAGFNYFINNRFTAFINPEYGYLGKDLSNKRRGYGPANRYYSVSAGVGFKF